MRALRATILGALVFAVIGQETRAQIEISARDGATIQPAGPRGGNPGKVYLNIEGKNNGKDALYASFGVLDFKTEKVAMPLKKVKTVKLTLVQSLIRHSKDGAIKLYISTDVKTALDGDACPLKYDPKSVGGLGDQLKPLHLLGETKFAKKETGETDTLTLTPGTEASAFLLDRLNSTETIRLVIVPADDDVAATYFGPGQDANERRPNLVITAE